MTIGHRTTATVASMYIPGSKNIDREEVSQIINNLPRPCILLRDFNAHDQMWEEQRTASRGRKTKHIININSLNILNNRQSMHVPGSAIVLSIVSPEITADCSWKVYPSVMSNDHHPIVITIETPVTQRQTLEGNFSYKKAY